MSASRRLRPRARGRSGLAAAAWLLLLPLRTGIGRRLAVVAVLTTLLVGLMSVLYDHADRPTANARQRAAPAPGSPIPVGAAGGGGGAGRGGVRAGPGAVAVAWYAARLGLPAGRVHALATQPTGHPRPGVRVLLLADRGHGQLATAWIHLHHTPTGWTVTP